MLVAEHDAVYFDLDGVLYLGPEVIPSAPPVVNRLFDSGLKVYYVTNNAARSVAEVARHLADLGYPAASEQVISAAQAGAALLAQDLPAGAKILVCGTDNLVNVVEEAGFLPVFSADDQPLATIQGYNPNGSWALHEEIAIAVQNGAKWYATNDDATRPTDRGIVPGAGGGIQLVGSCLPGLAPKIAGKPYSPIMDLLGERSKAKNPILVGDRLDTDISGATNLGMESLWVFTGVHGKADLLAAPKPQRPTNIGWDSSALFAPKRQLQISATEYRCGAQILTLGSRQEAELITMPQGIEAQLDALWALANAAWRGLQVSQLELDKLTDLP